MSSVGGVLLVRRAQLRVLARRAAGDDVSPFVRQARQHHPAMAAALGADLGAQVAKLRDLAFTLGLSAPADIHRFVDLGLVMGWPWLDAERMAITRLLDDARVREVSGRLDAVFEHALGSLEGGA